MKRIIPTLLVALFVLGHLNAQSTKNLRNQDIFRPAPMPDKSIETLLQNLNTANTLVPNPPLAIPRDEVGLLGSTIMDVQSYGSSGTRLVNYGNGVLSGIWMMGFNATDGWSDRGTGYNHYSDGIWGATSIDRIEGDVRTGFPSFAGTTAGKEVILTHKTPAPYEFRSYIKSIGEDVWVEDIPPTNTPSGMLWPRVSGDVVNGEYLHLIGITVDVGNGGVPYQGMDPHLLYYRSPDGGTSWDQVDVIISDLDSSFYNNISAESYAIDSRDNYVVIGVFPSWGDLAIFKSDDYGSTWTKTIVNDFPLDKYTAGDGYTLEDIGGFNNGPSTDPIDSLAIFTNDESGSVLIDNNGEVHVFFGEMYVVDADGLSYYPDWSGIRYWKESFGTDNTVLIADLEDVDNSGTIDIAEGEFGGFGNSLTSFPSAGIDADNNIYLAYSGVTEEFAHSTQLQHYRHIYIMKTLDGGDSWTEPYDLHNTDYYDEILVPIYEGVFPSIARLVDDKIHLMFQEDLSPGLVAWIDMDLPDPSNLVYFSINKEDFSNFSVNNKEISSPDQFSLTVMPNPAKEEFIVSYQLNEAGPVQITLHNTMGQVVRTINYTDQAIGHYQLPMSIKGDKASGLYFIQIRSGNNSTTKKIVIE